MKESNLRTAHLISITIALLAAVQSSTGLWINGIYRDNLLVTSGWLGNDLITLVVAVPMLLISIPLSKRDRFRWKMIWLGMLDYMLYNYAFYVFAAAFNIQFVVYVAIFALSILASILGVSSIHVDRIQSSSRSLNYPRWISGFMIFVAAGLTFVYMMQIINFMTTGELPQIVTATGHPTSVVFALDLSLVVPFFFLGALWLWQRQVWGFILAGIMNIKGAVYMLVLSSVTVSTYVNGAVEDLSQLAIWVPIGLGCTLVSMVLLRNMKPQTLIQDKWSHASPRRI